MQNVPAVIWDLDGTLVDSAPDLAGSLNTLLRQYGLAEQPLAQITTMIGAGVKRLVLRGFEAAGAPLSEADVAHVTDRFMEIYSARATRETALFPGVAEALEHLSAQGFIHGVCTNKPLAMTHQILDALKVSDHFKAVVGGDSTAHKKPDPAPMFACLKALGSSAAKATMVGDSAADLGVARAVNMPCVLVTFGYSSPTPASELGADATIGHFSELADTLARLGRTP